MGGGRVTSGAQSPHRRRPGEGQGPAAARAAAPGAWRPNGDRKRARFGGVGAAAGGGGGGGRGGRSGGGARGLASERRPKARPVWRRWRGDRRAGQGSVEDGLFP